MRIPGYLNASAQDDDEAAVALITRENESRQRERVSGARS